MREKIISPKFVCTNEHFSGVTLSNFPVDPPIYKVAENNINFCPVFSI